MTRYESASTRRLTRSVHLDRLTPHELETRDRALAALSRMRRENVSLTKASREAGTKPATVRRYAESGLSLDGSRWHATSSDRITRRQVTIVVDSDGELTRAVVETRSSRQATLIAKHNADIGALLSIRTSPEARAAARTRLTRRHNTLVGRLAFLNDGTVILKPRLFGSTDELIDAYDVLELGDIDYGSSASKVALR
jgi:hypothetical protein